MRFSQIIMRSIKRQTLVIMAALMIGAAGILWNGMAGAEGPSAVKPPVIKLTSQTIALPFGDRTFAGGEWAKAANTHCLLCHSRGMIDTQPPLPVATWQKEAEKMRSAYGCPLRDDQAAGIAQFISQQAASPVPPAGIAAAGSGSGSAK